jgi:transposase
VVLPTWVRKPRDKSKVEVAVLIVERFVLAKLRNRRFFSLDELNAEVRECVATINAKGMKKFAKSRQELLETIDRPVLNELPSEPYRYAEWKRCGVAPDYHVEVDDHYYSVPFRLLRETVDARLTDTTIEVFHKGIRVASHPRSSTRNRHTAIPEHMPSSHRRYAEWTPGHGGLVIKPLAARRASKNRKATASLRHGATRRHPSRRPLRPWGSRGDDRAKDSRLKRDGHPEDYDQGQDQ